MNKRAKSILAYSLLAVIILSSVVLLARAVMAYSAGNSNTNINYNLVTQDIAGRHYTPQCLGTCDLVFSLSYTGTLAPNSVSIDTNKLKSQFNFVKGVNKLKSYEINYLKEGYENITDYAIVCSNTTEYDAVNNTYSYPESFSRIINSSHLESRREWKKLQAWRVMVCL